MSSGGVPRGEDHRGEEADQWLADEVAERLRVAHRLVASLPADDERKAEISGRLIAISDAAKRDLRRAASRLDALFTELGWS